LLPPRPLFQCLSSTLPQALHIPYRSLCWFISTSPATRRVPPPVRSSCLLVMPFLHGVHCVVIHDAGRVIFASQIYIHIFSAHVWRYDKARLMRTFARRGPHSGRHCAPTPSSIARNGALLLSATVPLSRALSSCVRRCPLFRVQRNSSACATAPSLFARDSFLCNGRGAYPIGYSMAFTQCIMSSFPCARAHLFACDGTPLFVLNCTLLPCARGALDSQCARRLLSARQRSPSLCARCPVLT
jgi:hypothetical protein